MPVSLCMCACLFLSVCLSVCLCVSMCHCLSVSFLVTKVSVIFLWVCSKSRASVHVSVCGAVQVDGSVWLSKRWSVIDQPSVIFINQIVIVFHFIITVILYQRGSICYCVWYTLTHVSSDCLAFLPCIYVFVRLCDVRICCHVSCI